jgi:ubiquinol-cytochrome c reductase cytochrome b subunit
MLGAILVLMLLPIVDLGRLRGSQHRPLLRIALISLLGSFIILLVLGGNHVESPFIILGQIVSAYYFAVFFVLIAAVSLFENTLMDLNTFSLKDCTSHIGSRVMVKR